MHRMLLKDPTEIMQSSYGQTTAPFPIHYQLIIHHLILIQIQKQKMIQINIEKYNKHNEPYLIGTLEILNALLLSQISHLFNCAFVDFILPFCRKLKIYAGHCIVLSLIGEYKKQLNQMIKYGMLNIKHQEYYHNYRKHSIESTVIIAPKNETTHYWIYSNAKQYIRDQIVLFNSTS